MVWTAGRLAFLVCLSFAQSSLCHAVFGSAPRSMKSYTDEVGGISLHYPAVWTFSKTAGSYFSSAIAPSGEPVQAVFSFSPEGNFYEHTTLTGLQFLYRRQQAATRTECESILLSNRDLGRLEHLTLHGVPFSHLATGEAGMMKAESQEAYATWREGTCYLFEEHLDEISEGTDNQKTRGLTAAEIRALRRHLNDILRSVKFSKPTPAPAHQ